MRAFLLLLFSFLLLSAPVYSQVNTDSLEHVLPQLGGKERIKVLADLCWYLAVKDRKMAETYGQEALTLSQEQGFDSLAAQAYNDLGTLYLRYGSYDTSINYLNKSLEIRKELKDTNGISSVISKLAVIAENKADYAEALEYNLQSLEIFEKKGNKSAVCTLKGNIALIYCNLGQYDLAIKTNQEAINIAYQLEKTGLILSCLSNFGNIFNGLEDRDSAIFYMEEALTLAYEIEDENNQSLLLQNIGSQYLEKGDLVKASDYLQKALEIRERKGDKKGIVSTKSTLSKLFAAQGDLDKAIRFGQESLAIGKEIGVKENVMSTYMILSNAYQKKQLLETALAYRDSFILFKDSITNAEFSDKIAEMESKYNAAKRDQEIQRLNNERVLQDQELKARDRQRLFLIIILLFALVFVWYIYRAYKNKHRANELISEQKAEIEHKHQEITDSINYAKRIQTALLTADEQWEKISPENFVYFKPRDVVSGDFFWAYQAPNNIAVWVAADCTGHGVPGAFMSMLGVGFLNEIVVENNITNSNEILDRLRDKIIHALEQKNVESQQKDGMDIALCVWDQNTNKLQFSGAYNPLIVIRNKEILQIKADRQPIGNYFKKKPFETKEFQLEVGDILYTFSDGYPDQFGGESGGKFMIKRFKKLLVEVSERPMEEQMRILDREIVDWMGDKNPQTDDICVVGVKICD